jgi:hypothetical protein
MEHENRVTQNEFTERSLILGGLSEEVRLTPNNPGE